MHLFKVAFPEKIMNIVLIYYCAFTDILFVVSLYSAFELLLLVKALY